jgi:hypothetical protein
MIEEEILPRLNLGPGCIIRLALLYDRGKRGDGATGSALAGLERTYMTLCSVTSLTVRLTCMC